MTIYISNLSFKIDEADLREIFEEYGEVSSVSIITDKYSGKSKGFGFVDMVDSECAKKAIQELNNGELDGRKIVVNEARPKRERKPRY